jgi:hypothetical protein
LTIRGEKRGFLFKTGFFIKKIVVYYVQIYKFTCQITDLRAKTKVQGANQKIRHPSGNKKSPGI